MNGGLQNQDCVKPVEEFLSVHTLRKTKLLLIRFGIPVMRQNIFSDVNDLNLLRKSKPIRSQRIPQLHSNGRSSGKKFIDDAKGGNS